MRVIEGFLASTVVVYVGSLLVRDRTDYSLVFEGVVANVALGLSAVLCLLRAVVRKGGAGFAVLGIGGLMFTAGNVAYVAHVQFLDPVPFPSVADIGYLGAYPFFIVAVLMLARAELGGKQIAVWLDGLVGVLGMAAVGSALVLHTTLHDLSGDVVALIVGASYSLADLLVLSMIVGVLTLRGRRPDRRWGLLAGGLIVFAVADIIYLLRLSTDSYVQGSFLDALWVVGLAVLSLSAFRPARARMMTSRPGAGSLCVTIVFSVLAVVVLVAASEVPMPRYAIALAAATLLAGVLRAAIAFRQVRNVAELRHQVRTDDLTGLPNRRAFTLSIDQALTASPTDGGFAVVVLDIAQFNELNELFGRDVGDRLLREIAPRLTTVLRPDTAISRLGGGEFAVLLPGGDAGSAAHVGRRVSDALVAPFVLDDIAQQVSAHVGIALSPRHSDTADGLLQCADMAMRSARSQRTDVEIYDPVHGAAGRDRLALAKQLRIAVETNQFVLHYQPKVDLRSGAIVGVEALVRWEHPERGLLYPDTFLPIAEQIGCMNVVTRVVLATAIAQCSQWRLDGLELTMAVNLSASDLLDEDLVGHIALLLTTGSVPAEFLELEITETTLMIDPPSARATLAAIHALGVKLSVDDYGTGFSSLAYLRDLPVQELKIDRLFVTDLAEQSRGAAIVKSTVDLAHTLGLSVLAEGVENDEAFALLRGYGCDFAQGFHLCRPQAAAQLSRWLRTQSVHTVGSAVPSATLLAQGSITDRHG